MGLKSELRRLWDKQQITRISLISKEKLAKRRAAKQVASIADRIELEEVESIIAGMGLGSSNSQQDSEGSSVDPRFATNPNGEGCSKSFEIPSIQITDTEAISSAITSHLHASIAKHDNREDHFPTTSKEQESIFEPRTLSRPETISIDWSKGKRKGKADADTEESEELKTMQEWLAEVESGRMTPEEGWTRQRIMAIARKRALTY